MKSQIEVKEYKMNRKITVKTICKLSRDNLNYEREFVVIRKDISTEPLEFEDRLDIEAEIKNLDAQDDQTGLFDK